MAQIKQSIWQRIKTRIYHFKLSLNMCKCSNSKYEVIDGILSCEDCRKPKRWEERPN